MSAAYLRPTTLREALEALAMGGLRIGAGFTDIYPATERKVLGEGVLDITAIPELRGIAAQDGGLRIGAATTWTEIARAKLPPALRGLQQAAREVGGRQIQNRGTLGGNLCNASPAADGIPPLLTLDAEVEVQGPTGARRLPLAAFVTGARRTALASGEMLTAVYLPRSALTGRGAFAKHGARAYLVISIAMVAVRLRLDAGVVAEAALAVGACGPVACRLPAVEASLVGQSVDRSLIRQTDVAAALSPIDDVRGTAAHRVEAATVLLRRALADAAEARHDEPA